MQEGQAWQEGSPGCVAMVKLFFASLCGKQKRKLIQLIQIQHSYYKGKPAESSVFSPSHPGRCVCSWPPGTLFSSPLCSVWPSTMYCYLQPHQQRTQKVHQSVLNSHEKWRPCHSKHQHTVEFPGEWVLFKRGAVQRLLHVLQELQKTEQFKEDVTLSSDTTHISLTFTTIAGRLTRGLTSRLPVTLNIRDKPKGVHTVERNTQLLIMKV